MPQTYHLKLHCGTEYKNTYTLWNVQLSEDAAILIHPGNNYTDTEECLMFADAWQQNIKITDAKNKHS